MGVNARLGMGHGHAPEHNLAGAGLMLAADRVLSAHDLPEIKSCRRVLLSACVLGQIDDVFGEALGFMSASFGYQTEFGVGWLTAIPDADACLFSLAFQFALAEAERPDGGRTQKAPPNSIWLVHFRQTQQSIAKACWPAGFGGWLAANLGTALASLPASLQGSIRYPPLADAAALAQIPPPSLQRVAPWAVALGR